MIKAGFCERDITPPIGLNMPGYFIQRIAVGVKSPLGTHAVVVDDGKSVFALVSLDIKRLSGRRNMFVTALANAGVGYVPTREALEGGVYESKLSLSSSYLEFDTAEKMTDVAVELLKKIKI